MSWSVILSRFGLGWSIREIFYRLDWRTMGVSSVKAYLNRNVDLLSGGNVEVPLLVSTNRDLLALEAFRWVVDNIEYVSDQRKFGVKERWEDVDNILATRTGDCESMATLLFALMSLLTPFIVLALLITLRRVQIRQDGLMQEPGTTTHSGK